MQQRQLQQIKTFFVGNYSDEELESAVNDYVIERFNQEGNYPRIETNERFISVISDCLVQTDHNTK